MGTSALIIERYEQGEIKPSIEMAGKIAGELGVTVDYLLGSDEASIKDTALFQQFKAVDNLPDSEKNALVSVISAYIMYHKTKRAFTS